MSNISYATKEVKPKKEDTPLVKDYKKLVRKIRDENLQISISDEEIDDYFEPDFGSETSALMDYYKLLNIRY